MNLSLYLDLQTWMHRLDGRTKILSLLALFVFSLIFSDPLYLLELTSCVLGLVMMARSIENLRKIWILLLLLFIYSLILWPFFVEGGTPLFTIGGYVLSVEGVSHGMGMGLRLDMMLISGVLLLSTTTIEEFAQALHRLGVPQPMGFALSLAFRWVPTLLGSISTVIQAQQSRGLDLQSETLLGKIRQYPPLVVPLIGHTLRQTNLLAMALESKGFGPGRQRSAIFNSTMSGKDYGVLIIMAFLLGGGIWMRLAGYGTI